MRSQQRWLRPLAIALAATAVANVGIAGPNVGLRWLEWLGQMELTVHEWQLGSGPIAPSPEIVLIRIEEETPYKLGLERTTLPLPRSYHARYIRALREAGAHALILDLLFREESVALEDEALRQAVAASAPLRVTLSADYDEERSAPDPTAPSGWRYWFRRPVVLPEPPPSNVTVASAVAFDPGGRLSGAILLRPDEATGHPMPHVALSAVLGRFDVAPSSAQWDQESAQVRAASLAWPVGHDGEMLIRWTSRSGEFASYEYAEALGLLQSEQRRAQFREKIVIIGDTSGSDTHSTPLGRIDGLEFIAHVVNSLLLPASVAINRWTIPANAIWGLLLAMATAVGVGTLRPRFVILGLSGGLAGALLLPWIALAWWRVWVDTVGPCLAVVLAATSAGLVEGLRYSAQARHFVPRHVREERPAVLTEPATVMFVDLRGSTPMAEGIGPLAAQQLLSELLRRLSEIIVQHGGEVERTLGDGLMAVFRDRGDVPHAIRSASSARAVCRSVAELGRHWEEERGISAGVTIGIESGIVSGAVIRAGDREEWSSFGPVVNLASRLQGACQEMGATILMGPGARTMVHHQVATRFLGVVQMKGLEEPTPVYTLAGESVLPPQGSGARE